jgi:hypothetical protein
VRRRASNVVALSPRDEGWGRSASAPRAAAQLRSVWLPSQAPQRDKERQLAPLLVGTLRSFNHRRTALLVIRLKCRACSSTRLEEAFQELLAARIDMSGTAGMQKLQAPGSLDAAASARLIHQIRPCKAERAPIAAAVRTHRDWARLLKRAVAGKGQNQKVTEYIVW